MRKLSAKWVPRCLNAEQKCQQCQSSEQLLEFFWCNPNDFLSQLVTMDETWLYHYDPETKQQSMEWRHSSSPCPKKFRVQKSTGKVLASIFWDQDGILPIDHIPKGQTINTEYYSSLLVQVKDILKEKCRGKVTKGVLFLHGNAPTHRALVTQKKLAYLGFQCLLQIWPHWTTNCSLDWKNNWKVAIFLDRHEGHCRRGDLVGQTTLWIFF